MEISAAFESGSIEVIDASDPARVRLALAKDKGPSTTTIWHRTYGWVGRRTAVAGWGTRHWMLSTPCCRISCHRGRPRPLFRTTRPALEDGSGRIGLPSLKENSILRRF